MEFVNNRTVLFGENTREQITELLKREGKKRVFLIVFDSAAEFVKEIHTALTNAEFACTLFDRVTGEPNLELVDSAARECRENGCDCVLAVGGGSVIDVAKLVAMLAANAGGCEDYQLGRRTVSEQPLFYIAVPTTAGTGAEATRVAVVFNEKEGWKKAVYDNSMIADAVVLDPAATAALPQRIAVFTGMDAIVHAIESAVSCGANAISKMYSARALGLLYRNITRVYDDPADVMARTNMLIGSYLAGCALTAGAGLAHIVGQPLGALYHVPHGASCSIFLLPTMKLNRDYAREQFTEIAGALGIPCAGRSYDSIFEELLQTISVMMDHINAPRRLYDYYPQDMDVEAALDNIQSCMSHIKSNPRPSDRELWRQALELAK